MHEEPYKKQLAEKVSRLEYAFAHYFLWSGDITSSREYLAAALASAPPHLRFAQSKMVGWLSSHSVGPAIYGMMRRLRRLPPPFATTFGGTKPAAA